MYKENYIRSLHAEMLEMVAQRLSPASMKVGYSDVPLESNIKWKPLVLVLGNYSSGKSTLINELLGGTIQKTGQAPTDDSFTIITYDENSTANQDVHVTDERDGKVLLHDPEYPFETLKKHGQRFAAHFRLKKVNSPFLENLALVDTPGMLDSISERDRGYNYQEVIGDFAQIADLVLILFDPHKAGTVREAHQSLRETLPAKTFEDRVVFVLNRIDECSSLIDLLRVYGTLCWNLSQITGRKDIPMIHLTYSKHASNGQPTQDTSFLQYLENQREELKNAILEAPRHRLDHLATFVETHALRLSHLLEALINYHKGLRKVKLKTSIFGILTCLIAGSGSVAGFMTSPMAGALQPDILAGIGGIAFLLFLLRWTRFVHRYATRSYHKKSLNRIDDLTPLETQTRKDNWDSIKESVSNYLRRKTSSLSYGELKTYYKDILNISEYGSKEIREALNELASIKEPA